MDITVEPVDTIGVAREQLANATNRMTEIRLSMDPTGDDFDALVAEYSALQVTIVPLTQQVNAGALTDAKSSIGHLIKEAIGKLEIEKLLGQPIRSIKYEWITKDSEQPILTVSINQESVLKPRAPRVARDPNAPKVESNGERRDLRAEFPLKANADDLEKMSKLDTDKASGAITAKQYGSKSWSLMNSVANRA